MINIRLRVTEGKEREVEITKREEDHANRWNKVIECETECLNDTFTG